MDVAVIIAMIALLKSSATETTCSLELAKSGLGIATVLQTRIFSIALSSKMGSVNNACVTAA
jgi:hypothetical protein